MLTRDHLWHFLRQEAFADNIVELQRRAELHHLFNQFFDRAVYYAIQGYAEAGPRTDVKSDIIRVPELAVSIGLMSPRNPTSKILPG